MDDRKRGRGGRAKPTNEQRMESEDWKRFDRELERKGIRVEDPMHPLGGLPANRLDTAIRWALEAPNASMKSFLSTFAELSGSGYSSQIQNSWFRDSRRIPCDRLGFIVDILARYIADEMEGRLSGEIEAEAARLDPFCFGEACGCLSDRERYDAAYSLIVDCLYGLTDYDRKNLKRFAIIAALFDAEEDELDAIGGIMTCRMRVWNAMGRKKGREVLGDVCGLGFDESMTEVADGAISELVDAGALDEMRALMNWADDARSYAEQRRLKGRGNSVDVPF